MKTSELFKTELDYIKIDILKEITKRTLDDAPSCFKVIPASSSGKYHPMYAIKRGSEFNGLVDAGGLVLHTKAAVNIAHSVMQTKYFDDVLYNFFNRAVSLDGIAKVKAVYMDIVYAALLCHDTQKPDDTPQHNTRFDHPIEAVKAWLKNANIVLDEYYPLGSSEKERKRIDLVNVVARCIGSHMGEWNKSNYSDVVLPTPADSLAQFVHLCDFLASRRFLEFDFRAFAEVGR